MARKLKSVEVAKFGGIDHIGEVKGNVTGNPIKDVIGHTVDSVEAQSKTRLEDDPGIGNAAVIRMFEFGINPQAFKEAPPTRQDLFNAHLKGIEIALWKDGLKPIPEVNPRMTMDEKGGTYRIFIAASPMKGHILYELPQTLAQIAHG